MDYDVVKTHSQNAYKFYNNNDYRYVRTIRDFYKEGAKNPSVALVIMNDEVNKYNDALYNTAKKIEKGKKTQINLDVYSPEQRNILNTSVKNKRQGAMFELAVNQTKAEYILRNDIIKILPEYQNFYDTFEKLYPNSKDKRLLITYLSMDKTTPKKTWAEKIMALYPIKKIYQNYPKTYALRMKLLEDGRIQDKKVLPKVKNYLQRQMYKKLLR